MNVSSAVGIARDSFFAEGDKSGQEVVFGPKSIDQLGSRALSLGRRVLLVTDSGLTAAGHPQRVMELLEYEGLKVTLFDQSIENPTDSSVQSCAEVARDAEIDVIVGLGGGSSMDTAKGCNFILTNGGSMADYWGIGKAKNSMFPLVAVPTTAGTGSECQSFALISDDRTHRKMACGDRKALPCLTVLDPELTLSQPERVTACTGVDALAHALESIVCNKRNELSQRHSKLAFELIQENLPRVISSPDDLEARGFVQLGASHAGAAIERSMLGAAHSMANPLTARLGTVHGTAVGLALPAVMEFNAMDEETRSVYAELARNAQLADPQQEDESASSCLIERVRAILRLASFPTSLSALGFSEKDLDSLAKDASDQWTANFNPRPVHETDFKNLYAGLLHA
ncbi:MAG TPA: alcohol dehydrogenase [Opitutae bacterium]|nr:alcohol dehydrogenase [Opitutae bacterium]|tara:strand:+ start:2676 stop:3875 length:1200 start_codon:yes stop_codon:yes gene_type:complete